MMVGVLLILILIVAWVVAMVKIAVDDDQDEMIQPTMAPSSFFLSPSERLEQILPSETIERITQKDDTPQAMAYEWILEELELEQETNVLVLSDERLKQRFVLACFFMATKGPEWYNNTNWLNHNVHECYWWSQPGYVSETDSTDYFNLLGDYSNPCELKLQHNETPVEEYSFYKHLWLYNNNLQGNLNRIAPELSMLTSLRSIVVEDNAITGNIPPQLGMLGTNLEVISFASTQLSSGSSIPTELGKLPSSLQALNLVYSGLTGPLPSQVGLLTKLQSLLLEYNELTGTLPSQICNIQTLGGLWMAGHEKEGVTGNKMVGTIPNCLGGKIPNLGDEVYLEDNLFTGTMPSSLARASKVDFLWVKSNLLTGTIPSQIFSIPNRKALRLEGNQFTGTIPTFVVNDPIVSLDYLDISTNQLSGSIPSQLGRFTSLSKLFLHENDGLMGSIPTQLGQCTYMLYLALNWNLLEGTIPSELFRLEYLHDLWLDHNQLTGTIPTQLGNLGVQETEYTPIINLEHNQLSGTIPTELGRSTLFYELSLASNSLTGSIPSQLGTMLILEALKLQDNPLLTGTVPQQLGLLTNLLTVLNISGTQLTGTIPEPLCTLESLDFDCSPGVLCGCDCPCSGPLPTATRNRGQW